LFERLQTLLLAIVLDDKDLAERAARVLAEAGTKVSDDRAVLATEVVGVAGDSSMAFVERRPAELHWDLRMVGEQLIGFSGLSTAEILQSLMERAPDIGNGLGRRNE
jgi:nucleotide-binding universal stress UspA family protein